MLMKRAYYKKREMARGFRVLSGDESSWRKRDLRQRLG
jgi:hypothetical protein